MTPEAISATLAVVLSLVLAYVPGLKDWYQALANDRKVALTGVLIVLVGVGTLAYGCRADTTGIVACVTANWEGALSAIIAALVANQATYTLLVKPFKKA